MLSLVVAATPKGVIGKGGGLPWHLPSELKHFKKITMGKPVIMGRRTFESLPKGPLPGRKNIVLSRQDDFLSPGGVEIFRKLSDALLCAQRGHEGEIMVIGGAHLYRQCLLFADCVYLTEVKADLPGDTFFPLAEIGDWEKSDLGVHSDENDEYPFSCYLYKRPE